MSGASPRLEVLPIEGIPEIEPGTDLAALVVHAVRGMLQEGDILAITSKVV